MNFIGFDGNEELKARLNDIERNDSFFHAYIIWGPEGSGKEALAELLANAAVCSGTGDRPCLKCRHCAKTQKRIHPDIIRIRKEQDKREIYVSQIRDIVQDAVILPNEADKKVYIIEEADDMNTFAQNAFLKILEEPPSHALFILLGTNPGSFLQTVRSRCVELQTVSDTIRSIAADQNSQYALAQSVFEAFRTGKALKLISETAKAEKLDKPQISDFLDSLYLIAAEALKSEPSASSRENIYGMLDLLHVLMPMRRFNVGSGHIAGYLAAKLISI